MYQCSLQRETDRTRIANDKRGEVPEYEDKYCKESDPLEPSGTRKNKKKARMRENTEKVMEKLAKNVTVLNHYQKCFNN